MTAAAKMVNPILRTMLMMAAGAVAAAAAAAADGAADGAAAQQYNFTAHAGDLRLKQQAPAPAAAATTTATGATMLTAIAVVGAALAVAGVVVGLKRAHGRRVSAYQRTMGIRYGAMEEQGAMEDGLSPLFVGGEDAPFEPHFEPHYLDEYSPAGDVTSSRNFVDGYGGAAGGWAAARYGAAVKDNLRAQNTQTQTAGGGWRSSGSYFDL